jgi:phospholipase C
MTGEGSQANLEKVDHIVVLMLENRSFDHMLGYLSLEGGRRDIDGLHGGLANEFRGRGWPVHHLRSTVVAEDPDHTARSVDLQIGGGKMDGFVASYAAALVSHGVPDGDPSPIMGYYGAADVPVYDHLAAGFAVCDRWFSSVPGATWPNRLYALCGRAAGSRDDRPHNLPPLYDQPSFVRHLEAHGVSWRWYSGDVGSLRLADQLYCLGHHDRFAYVTKTGLPGMAKLNWRVDADVGSFLEDAAHGALPSVSWIDPNWGNFNPFGFRQNDDHPPADIRDGQDLVLAVYHALAAGPQWEKTLLIIFYDEHGGFFDHVPPPEAPDDDPGIFGHYGVRVPALIVSPWVPPRTVSKTLFDHTSIIKTIMQRFCAGDFEHRDRRRRLATWLREGHPHYLGTRVAQANDLGELLISDTPRPAPAHHRLVAAAKARADDLAQAPGTGYRDPDQQPLSDLQKRVVAATRLLGRRGHPAGRP